MKLRFSPFSSALTGALLLVVGTGCGGGSRPQNPTTPSVVSSIAFVSNRDGGPEIYVMNPDGSNQRRVTTGITSAATPSQSRDGRIVFSSNRDGNPEIYRVNRDGTDLTRLTSDAANANVSDTQPVFSPDGNTIAWTSDRGGSFNVWLMDATGANQRQFTSGQQLFGNPAWTSDSRQLGYVVSTVASPNSSTIEVRNVASNQVAATSAAPLGLSPSHLRFNNDGSKVIYAISSATPPASTRTQIYDFTARTVSAGPTSGAQTDGAADFSSDGRTIVFQSGPLGGTQQIFRAGADGTGVRALTTQGSNLSPDF